MKFPLIAAVLAGLALAALDSEHSRSHEPTNSTHEETSDSQA